MCSHKVSVLKVDESKKFYALEAPTVHTFLCCGSHKTSSDFEYCLHKKATGIIEYLLFLYCSVR